MSAFHLSKLLRGCGWFFLLFVMTSSFSAAAPDGDERFPEFGKILERYRFLIIEQGDPREGTVRELLATLGEDGRWADLDYADQSRGNWHPYQHLGRVRLMALAWADEGHVFYDDSAIESAIFAALDDWIVHRYRAVNWWFNEIGIPRFARDIVVLMGKRLDGDRRERLLEIIAQYRLRGTGANLVWTAELAFHYGCLTGNGDLLDQAVRRIHNEITVGAAEGIQKDWSFFQHGSRLQTFHYGRSYLEVVAAVAWQLRGTKWAVPGEKVEAISNFILEGMQWMLRGRSTVPGTMDRMVSRPGTLRMDLRPTLRFWREVDPARSEEIQLFIARQEGSARPLTGFRHFAKADFTAYHRPEFSFFLKTVSDRTHLTESINAENLLGRDLHTGDHYWITDESDYHNLPPLWDWERLPGVTRGSEPLRIKRQAFVGGLGDGQSGLAAMALWRGAERNSLAVRRLWAFYEDRVLGLWGGWENEGKRTAVPYTGLDQRRWKGDMVVGFGDGTSRILDEGEHVLGDVRSLWHDGIVYWMVESATVRVRLGEASGSWHRINRNRSAEPISEKVFLAVLEHGEDPRPGGFVMAPADSADKAAAWFGEKPWTVLRNDRACQAVLFGEKTMMVAFFDPGELESPQGDSLSVDRPCLILWSDGQLRLADPTHDGVKSRIGWRGREKVVTLPPGGEVVILDDSAW